MLCFKCSIKLKPYLVYMTISCKCGNVYCNQCKLSHDCSYDYFGENQKRLREKLTKIEGKKMDKI